MITNEDSAPRQAVAGERFSLISLIAGIVSFVGCFGVGGVVAIVFGVLARTDLKRRGLHPNWYSTVGIVLGILNIVVATAALAATWVSISQLSYH
jgi:hypothetical protein